MNLSFLESFLEKPFQEAEDALKASFPSAQKLSEQKVNSALHHQYKVDTELFHIGTIKGICKSFTIDTVQWATELKEQVTKYEELESPMTALLEKPGEMFSIFRNGGYVYICKDVPSQKLFGVSIQKDIRTR